MILHVFEACIWAAFYAWYKLFPDWETSIYFSVVSYATIGYGDVVLPETWRLLGAIEGITGVLLCGVSTAFLFAIINAFFRMRVEQIQEKRSD
jgi:voltage-gated potassium channel Kch